MATARARFQAHVDGLDTGDFPLSVAWSLATATGKRETLDFAAGDNTLSVPTGTSIIVISPPTNNGEVLKLKGAGGDTGKTLNSNKAAIISHGGGVTIVNAAGIVLGVEIAYI